MHYEIYSKFVCKVPEDAALPREMHGFGPGLNVLFCSRN